MVKGLHKKKYIGGLRTEIEAAKTHDIQTILVRGLEAKTNFDYTASEVESFLNGSFNVK